MVSSLTHDEIAHLKTWIGRTEERSDVIALDRMNAMAATLDWPAPPAPDMPLPPLWQWMFFTPTARHSDIDGDGHPRRGGFLPPVPLPRRMFAGGRFNFLHPLRAGDVVQRRSVITQTEFKRGKSGDLIFVCVRHEIRTNGDVAIEEENDIVYRDAVAGEKRPAEQAPRDAVWHREIHPDPVLLFRYSALTFNGHRIHYDRPYTTQTERYPGLVVHGPLIATLLLDLARTSEPTRAIEAFSFRAKAPLFDIAPFRVCGAPDGDNSARLWAETIEGGLAMESTVRFKD